MNLLLRRSLLLHQPGPFSLSTFIVLMISTVPMATAAPVVLELFTSEGCSSCPPADRVLSEIVDETRIDGIEIIPLGWHVDYWNNLGWTDRFSKAEYTQRQRGYARAGNRTSVFTPEAVLNGLGGINGSDRPRILHAARILSEKSKVEVKVSPSFTSAQSERLNVAIEISGEISVRDEDPVQIVVLITEDNLSSAVKRGENSGRSLQHDGVVRFVKQAEVIQNQPVLPYKIEFGLDWNPEWKRKDCRAVVLLQEKYSRLILGAGSARVQNEE